MSTRVPLQHPMIAQMPDPPMPPMPPMPPVMDVVVGGPPEWVGVVAVLTVAIVGATIVLFPLARAWARRIDRRQAGSALPADVAARLERIETAVEAMALEVERISEGQRFLTRVMSELRALPAAGSATAATPPERTPGSR